MFLALNSGNFSKDVIGMMSTVAKCNFLYTIVYFSNDHVLYSRVTGLLHFFGCKIGSPNKCKSEYLEFRVPFFGVSVNNGVEVERKRSRS